MDQRTEPIRKLDLESLALLVVGLSFAVGSIGLISVGFNPLIIVPSILAIAIGASHMTKYEAPREAGYLNKDNDHD